MKIHPTSYATGKGRPLQSTFPLTRRMKFGQAKHWTNETVLLRTGHLTASFFIRATCFPLTTPLSSSTYCFGVGSGFSGLKISTTYFVGGGSLLTGVLIRMPLRTLIILISDRYGKLVTNRFSILTEGRPGHRSKPNEVPYSRSLRLVRIRLGPIPRGNVPPKKHKKKGPRPLVIRLFSPRN